MGTKLFRLQMRDAMKALHYDIDSNCPSSCEQNEDCSIIRGAHRIAHKIVDRIGSKEKILEKNENGIFVPVPDNNLLGAFFHLGALNLPHSK